MQVKLTIKDVIYIPNFHTNIVSLSRAKVEDIGFDTPTGILAHCDPQTRGLCDSRMMGPDPRSFLGRRGPPFL